jgi:hypothetical protein
MITKVSFYRIYHRGERSNKGLRNRQDWLSSYPSFESAHPQLQSEEMPQGRSTFSAGEAHHLVFQFEIIHVPDMGRTAKTSGQLSTSAATAPAAEANSKALEGANFGIITLFRY